MRIDAAAPRPKLFPPPRHCDCCNSAAALLFCRPESVFLCLACDARTHDAAAGRHDRVWVCEVCEQAPAAVTCRADAAALCVACDRDIHSANPLAGRHERVPVSPFYDTAESIVVRSAASALLDGVEGYDDAAPDRKAMELFLQDSVSDQFLDFDNYPQPFSDSVVPVQTAGKPPVQLTGPENRFEIDFTKSIISSYNNSRYAAPSLSHSVSSSSMEVGVVPDGSSLSETSYPFSRVTNRSLDPSDNPVVKMDREARVLRYKEKRKNRKFEKTIRYASRKAYAETRPRIKGRFAKRTDPEPDIDRIFSATFIDDSRYGVVPSF